MNDNAKIFLAFAVGVTAGSFATWKMLEKKYKQIADDEIASVKEMCNRKAQAKKEEKPVETMADYYGTVVEDLGYKKESRNKEVMEDMAQEAMICVIPPEEFGETGFETESLTYYADEVLAYNVTNDVIENVDEVVGRNSLKTFGEYEDDSVFVRNENMKKDFEILLDMRKYSDVVSRKPHLVEDGDDD